MKRIAALLACLLLAACGQKGSLYLPDEARPVAVPATTTPSPAPAATGDAGAAAAATADEEQRRRQQQAAPGNNPAGN
jgi:predicted small lipoprotein YifL